MSLILNIDTAGSTALVSLAVDEVPIAYESSEKQQDYSAWLHAAIDRLLKIEGKNTRDIKAVAVSNGPGSYTGLRIGLSAAKGLCYALNIPLITISTLELMAYTTKKQLASGSSDTLYCPMIDARRMEVFMALYNEHLLVLKPPQAIIVHEDLFLDIDNNLPIVISGNGHVKAAKVLKRKKIIYHDIIADPQMLSEMAFAAFKAENFAELAYSEPFYIKDFYSGNSQTN